VTSEETTNATEQVRQFAREWNELYAAQKFEEMKALATEDVGIANAQASRAPTGLIYGRQAYYDGIYEAYHGSTGNEHNLLVMDYDNWEYIPLGPHTFYTIGRYTLQPDAVGVNGWLLRRDSPSAPWRIFRVINN
jgi:hypothetical protein